MWRNPLDNTPSYFHGSIEDNRFKVMRIINGRNSFLPVVSGTIRHIGNETVIFVKFRPHLLVLSLLAFLFLSNGATEAIFLTQNKTGKIFDINIFSILFFVAFLVMAYFWFWKEVDKQKKYLTNLFNSSECARLETPQRNIIILSNNRI